MPASSTACGCLAPAPPCFRTTTFGGSNGCLPGRPGGIRFVVVESLFSMDGDVAPLAEYAALCRSAGAVLVVDEAHAVGIYGGRGSGLMEAAGIDDENCIAINTAGKALGVAGAFVTGPSWAVEYLLQRARPFVFSTAPPPALADALDASLTIVAEEPERRERLLVRAAYLRARLAAAGIDTGASRSQIIPIAIGENDRAVAVARLIQAEDFDVRAIRPPSVPAGTARLRVSVNAGLSEATLDRFVDVLAAARGVRTLSGRLRNRTDTASARPSSGGLMHRYRSLRQRRAQPGSGLLEARSDWNRAAMTRGRYSVWWLSPPDPAGGVSDCGAALNDRGADERRTIDVKASRRACRAAAVRR